MVAIATAAAAAAVVVGVFACASNYNGPAGLDGLHSSSASLLNIVSSVVSTDARRAPRAPRDGVLRHGGLSGRVEQWCRLSCAFQSHVLSVWRVQ